MALKYMLSQLMTAGLSYLSLEALDCKSNWETLSYPMTIFMMFFSDDDDDHFLNHLIFH